MTDLRDWMRAKAQAATSNEGEKEAPLTLAQEVLERLDRLEAKVDRILIMLGRP